LKIGLFEVLDAAKDVQLKVESAQYIIQNNAKKINRYIGKKSNWYYQHKYAVKTATNCEEFKGELGDKLGSLKTSFVNFYSNLLPTLGHNIAATLKTEHDAAVAEIERLTAAERDEPARPTYEQFRPDPATYALA
jgi:hypothetical protein